MNKIKDVSNPFQKYTDRFPNKFDFSEFETRNFKTGCFRTIIQDLNETDRTIGANNNFNLYFKIPPQKDKNISDHLFIFINGFDEIPTMMSLYYSVDSSLSRRLSNIHQDAHGFDFGNIRCPSVLLPIPFHHWRRPVSGEYQEVDSETMIYNDPIRLYLGFRQLLYDAQLLINDLLIRDTNSKYNPLFNENLNINLLGYSLGGLGALSIFLFNRLIGGPEIPNCFLLASGVNLLYTNMEAAKINYESEKEIKAFYYKSPHDWKNDLNKPEYQVKPMKYDGVIENLFERIVLGYREIDDRYDAIEREWNECQNKISYVTCGMDDVMYPEVLHLCVPENVTPKEIYTLEDAPHWLAVNRIWKGEVGKEAVFRIVQEAVSN